MAEHDDGRVQIIEGYPFLPDPRGLSDLARCQTCGQTVDVGFEIRAHVAGHEAERLEIMREVRR